MKKLFVYLLMMVMALPSGATIKSKELLQISIQGVPQSEQMRLNSTYAVSASGTITMWEIGTLRASGRTPGQLAASIASAYKAKGIYTNPTFQVIQQRAGEEIQKTITVGGQVRGAGTKPFLENMTIYDAVSQAGGATPFGAVNRVKLYRNAKVYTYNLKTDAHKRVKLYPGDAIEVPEKNWMGQ
ncbi:MAG: polysaccharide biosynthesis/export family protein [Verrucomicrobiales bacterium]